MGKSFSYYFSILLSAALLLITRASSRDPLLSGIVIGICGLCLYLYLFELLAGLDDADFQNGSGLASGFARVCTDLMLFRVAVLCPPVPIPLI